MSNHPLILLMTGLMTTTALATTQEEDLLILEGQRIYTYELPKLKEAFPSIAVPEFQVISTANYKGYRATWATFQKQLYLVGLEARVAGKNELVRNEEITPGHSFPLKVTDWSGQIIQTDKSSSLDTQTMTWTDITVTTAIVVTKGVVTDEKVAIDRVPRMDKKKQPSGAAKPNRSPGR